MTLSIAELAAIRERCEKATPGPWELIPVYERQIDSQPYLVEVYGEITAEPNVVCATTRADTTNLEADTSFIVHARTDIPALLSHIESLQRQIEHARDMCARPEGTRLPARERRP